MSHACITTQPQCSRLQAPEAKSVRTAWLMHAPRSFIKIDLGLHSVAQSSPAGVV